VPALPGDLNGWFGLLSAVISSAGVIGLGIWRLSKFQNEQANRFKSQGERIGAVEQRSTSAVSAVEELRRIDQQHEFKIMSLTEGHGELRTRFEQIVTKLEVQDERKREAEREVTDRLARIEEQLKIFVSLYSERRV
jgi:coproporphyrinogen III oxidase-like Fe-S oxidoreductase